MIDTSTPAKSGTKPVGAAKLTIEILRCLAKQRGAIGVTPLANKLNRYPGTVYAVLKTLQAEGVVEFNPSTKTYRLCLGGILEISALKREQDLPRKIEQEMSETSDQFGVTIYLSQKVRPNAMIIIACAAPDQPLGLYAKIGHRFPVLMGAVGRLVSGMAGIDDEHLLVAYAEYRWNRHQPNYEDWSKQVRQDIASGYAYEEDSMPEGLATIAVPVKEPSNNIKFMINISGPRGDFVGERLPQLVTVAKKLAERAKSPR